MLYFLLALGCFVHAMTPVASLPFASVDMSSAAAQEIQEDSHIHTITLHKQYVPISKNGSVIAYKTAYFGELAVGGDEKQNFTVVFDTGSGHLILPSSRCHSETCMKHRRYNSSESKTAVDIEHDGKPISREAKTRGLVSIKFGTGEVLGEFVEDSVCLGTEATSSDCMTLRVVLATEMSAEPFGQFAFDGVLGLGLEALTLNAQFSFFGQLVAQNPKMQPHFAVFLARNDLGQSAISFGGHEAQWAASEIQWAPVNMPELGYWQVAIKSVRIGDTILDDCADGGCRAILDTGTSLLGVPRQSSRTMHRLLARAVPGEQDDADRANVDCRTVHGQNLDFDLGDFVVSLGPQEYSRPKSFNITAPSLTNGWELFCRSLLLPVDMAPPMGPKVFIWGEPVLRKYLTLYDWGRKEIGFALAGVSSARYDAKNTSAVGAPPQGSLVTGSPLGHGLAAVDNTTKHAADNATAIAAA